MHKVNDEIVAKHVRLIDEQGNQKGVYSIDEARKIAREEGLDLIQVGKDSETVVRKIMDYGKLLFDSKKKQKQIKKNKALETREIRIRPSIGDHDLQVKVRKIIEFLEKGSKVRLDIRLKGRERHHPERIALLLEKIARNVSSKGNIQNKGEEYIIIPT